MSKLLTNKWLVIMLLVLVAFVTQLFFAISISPLTPFEGYDSCVFKQMGEAFLQGKTPYLDLFDHKGPILLLIDALGFTFSDNRWGIFLLSIVNVSFVLYVWHKTAKLYVNEKYALLPVFVALMAYLGCMEEGNLTEDWSLLPNSFTLYLLARLYVKDIHIKVYEYLAVGLLTGCVIFIRANNISIIATSALFLTYIFIKRQQWLDLVKAYISVLAGVAIVAVATICLFYLKYGSIGVEQMFFGTFGFNFMYAGFSSYYDFLVSSMCNHAYFLGAIMLTVFAHVNNKDNKEFTLFVFLSFLFCFYIMGTASFRHYMINVAPLFLIASCCAFQNSIKPYIVFIAVAILTFEPFFKRQLQFSIGQVKREYARIYDEGSEVINKIETGERNNIWNYNAEMTGIGILQHNKLVQSNRVVLNFQRGIAPELAESENGKLERVAPKYILVDPTKSYVLPEDSVFINKNYEVIKELRVDVSSKNVEEHRTVNIMKHK